MTAVERIRYELDRLDLRVVNQRGGGFMAQCPAHDDREPSLSVVAGRNGDCAAVHCFAGCDTPDVLDALGLPEAALFDDYAENGNGHTNGATPTPRPRPKPEAPVPLPTDADLDAWRDRLTTNEELLGRLRVLRGWTADAVTALGLGLDGDRIVFPVRDQAGALVGVGRYQPDSACRNGTSKMLAAAGSSRELFPAPETVDEGKGWLWLVEGEPDAVAALSAGLKAVGVPGVGKWGDSWAERFRGRSVVVCLDCDEKGRERAVKIERALVGVAATVRRIDLDPGRTDGYDLGDLVREAAETDEKGYAALRGLLGGMADAATPAEVSATTPPAGSALVSAPPVGASEKRRLTFTPASAVRPRATRWLWHGLIPLGAVTVLVGEQGLGKSTLSTELAAQLSRGELPGALSGEPSGTLLVSYEDNAASTIVPRLFAAQADRDLVQLVSATGSNGAADLVSVSDDLPELAEGARANGARLLVVDPLVAGLTGKTDAHRDQDVRQALAPLAQLAEEHDLAVLTAMHFNKGADRDVLRRVSGSTAFTAAARSVLAWGRDPVDPEGDEGSGRVLAHAKCNVGPLAPARAYRLEGCRIDQDGERIDVGRLAVVGPSEARASDLLPASQSDDDRSERDDAIEWLHEYLADGQWRESREVKAAAKAAGHSMRTVERARPMARVEVKSGGYPKRTDWRLPTVAPPPLGATDSGQPGATGQTRIPEPDTGGSGLQSRHGSDGGATGPSTLSLGAA